MRLQTYADVVETTLINEREINDSIRISNQRKAAPTSGGPIRNNNQGYVAPKPYNQNNNRNDQPWRNNNQNRGPNQVPHQNQQQNGAPGGVKCFHCNQKGHMKRYCPQLMGFGSSGYGGHQQQSYQGRPVGQGNQYQGNPNHQKLGWNPQQQRQFQNQGMRKGPEVRVFTWNECKRECVNACGKPSYRAALLEDDGVQKNRRQEATEYGMSLSTLYR
ncbi:hypothetical protein RHSIM_Rhsim09G0012700 [Rhododendron simsii]|uniref:CCHC-type domain-containing protein n=1 Tax=Rhododendron simsii TaxID=118357 RepID=A0A834GD35_RHOSS|nr:hypothetical protein RHSIM_Rhsim09G0012700 [Rhododendron simsii]